MTNTSKGPEILAPAGDREAFLAALAAGADAIYLGLKHFSARMQAENFSLSELAALTELARARGSRVYVAMNTLVKPGDVESAGRLLDRLARHVRPAGLIVQDLALPALARQVGYEGELHLSTLANVSHPAPLAQVAKQGISRVVMPRELNVDEIKAMAQGCPEGLDLEVFVHGALCYNVSGRCWWSSYMGGKSGLRGRCVQPCRREYEQRGKKARFFSCNDLGLDVLVKALLDEPRVAAWKIEGRKKSAHYVYYTTSAYRLLRDEGGDPAARKTAQGLLDQALSRQTTHYGFLPQRTHVPTEPGAQTGSGLAVARTGKSMGLKQSLSPRMPLLKGDLLRVGYQDEPWHQTVRVTRAVPKGGRLDFKARKGGVPKEGTPVFLIDRREPELARRIAELDKELAGIKAPKAGPSEFVPALPKPGKRPKGRSVVQNVNRRMPKSMHKGAQAALWLAPKTPVKGAVNLQWWLPPVIWPGEEDLWSATVAKALKSGVRRFVLGAPWQAALFERALKEGRGKPLELWAGPFCNLTNALALEAVRDMGCVGAFVSPELSREDALALPATSPVPLGFVTYGLWPLGITRVPPEGFRTDKPLTSPKGEVCWARRYGQNTWIYPGWGIDLRNKERELAEAGYTMFAHIFEPVPREVPAPTRTSTFNWDLTLL
ncbi:peptidase U32 family protein [Desulfocurvus sp. DL9XJH121]